MRKEFLPDDGKLVQCIGGITLRKKRPATTKHATKESLAALRDCVRAHQRLHGQKQTAASPW